MAVEQHQGPIHSSKGILSNDDPSIFRVVQLQSTTVVIRSYAESR